MPGWSGQEKMRVLGEVCESCKREASHSCQHKTGLFTKCRVPLCDECTHFTDGRVPMHDRYNADRSGNKLRAEEQAEELMEIADAANSAVTAIKPKPVSERQRRKQRDDLVQL